MRIDHVLYGVADLDEAAARFEREHGLASYPGGNHPAFGTGNRIVPLGESYVELIAVTDPSVAAANPVGQSVAAAADAGGGWLGWVVAVDDLDAVAARLGLFVLPGERRRPDGMLVSWRAAGMERLLEDPAFPFFIAWDDASAHPGASGRGSIAWVEVGIEADAIRSWLAADPAWLRVVPGAQRGLRAVAVESPGGPVVIR